jgi:hypothetical protein
MSLNHSLGCRLPIVLLVAVFLGCGTSGIEFTLRNLDAARLDSVVVRTTGFSYPLGDLPAGVSRTVRVQSTGESHIEVEHGAKPRLRLVVDTYFERGYSGTVTADVRRDTVVRLESHVR